jgi:NAD(P)-dependent dehydrogenase (short-subunit alcohol dehydrogenase family)
MKQSMSDRLKNKVALVSDAGSSGPGWGNGKATAVLFAREGAKVLKLTSTSMRPRDQADH